MKKLNVFLPPYVIFAIIPLFWIITLGITFVVDTIILLIVILLVYKKFDFATYKKTILKIWLLGFSTYFIGCIYLYIVAVLNSTFPFLFGEISSAIEQSHFDSIWGLIYVISGILISSILIFVFNYYISFKKTDFTKKQKVVSSLVFSVATAPYFFLLPNTFFDYISTYINFYDFSIFSIF